MTEAIRKKRKELGLTQKQLGEKVGVEWNTISNLENEKNINYRLLKSVCDVLGLEIMIVDVSPIEPSVVKKKAKYISKRVIAID